MQTSKFFFGFLLLFSITLFTACNNDEQEDMESDLPLTQQAQYYQNFCEQSNGSLTLNVDGKGWDQSCVYGFYQETALSDTSSYELLYLYGFTNQGAFLNKNSYEAFFIIATLENGVVTNVTSDNSYFAACYIDGVYNFSNINTEDVNSFWEGEIYCTSEDNPTNRLSIQRNGNQISGNFADLLIQEEGSDQLSVNGDFQFNIQ